MRTWPSAAAIVGAAALLGGCGDEATSSLVVGENHVVSNGAAGDVAVALGHHGGLAVWSALDTRALEFIRVEEDGAPVAALQTMPGVKVGPRALVRAATTPNGFVLLAVDPDNGGELGAVTLDAFVLGMSPLPSASAVALSPPILALVDPMTGALLLGDVGNDSPKIPTLVEDTPQDLIAVGAAFAKKHGIVVMVTGSGCISAFSVTDVARPTGHVSETRCFGGDWQSATAAAWQRTSVTDAEDFAIAVGLSGVVDDAMTTQGFALEIEVDKKGHLETLRASPAPFQPSSGGFAGRDDVGLQLSDDLKENVATRFDAAGHPLDPTGAVVWQGKQAGSVRALTSTSATSWLALVATGHGKAGRVYARSIGSP